ncbi:MAG: tripartite tricarboxylate transporter substrate binding protein [Betaproteobacteria bacterium]|nr:MAG: tripartite tricarboxylate transporter substrate binding protein [Betaproteobacteria bacterium]
MSMILRQATPRKSIETMPRARVSWRRGIARAGSIALAGYALASQPLAAQPYPNRAIHIVVAAEPGGQSDLMARAIATSFTRTLGQPVVIENRTGSGGTIGAHNVAQARADGHTLLIGGINNMVLATLLRSDLPYAPADLLPLGGMIRVLYGIAVTSRIPVKDLAEFAAYARAHPGEVSFASGGTGSSSQLAIELLKSRLALDMFHVPYRGILAAMPDLVSGRVDMLATDLALLLPLEKAGSIHLLAVGGARRASAAPQIPTVAEQGLPGYAVEPWYGLFAPVRIPKEIADTLSRALAEALRSDEVRKVVLAQGYEPMPLSGEALRALAAEETKKYAAIVEAAGLRNSQ